ncbi:MAG: WD40 repeat domain-containing protein [Planctomycetaceae bacterium]
MRTPVAVDPQRTKLLKEYKLDRPLTSCHWDPRLRFIWCGAEDHLIHRIDPASDKRTSLAGHDSWVRAFATSADGDTLYSGGYDGRLMFWPAAVDQPEPSRTIDAHRGWIRAVAVSPDGRSVATCGNDRLVKVWDASSGMLIREFSGHTSHVYNLIYSLDSRQLFTCDLKGVVLAWSLSEDTPRSLLTVTQLHGYDTTFRADIGGARCIALRADGGLLGLGGITKVSNAFAGVGEIIVALVNPADGKLELALQSRDKTGGTLWGLAWHPDKFWIGVCGGGGGGWIYFWKGDAAEEFFRLKLPNDGRGMSLSADGRQIAVAHADGRLRTYQLT